MPATGGPIRRAPLNMAEFKAMALPRSSFLSTTCTTMEWRAGASRALATPRKKASGSRCQGAMALLNIRMARTKAWIMARDWATSMMCMRFQRSASTPARGDMKKTGTWAKKATSPR